MASLHVLTFLILALYSATISGKLQYGQLRVFLSKDEDFKCKRYDFVDKPFAPTDQVHVQLRLRLHEYQAAVSWVESVSFAGFTGCVTISGPIRDDGVTVYLTWLAFKPSEVGSSIGLVRVENINFWTTGTKCVEVRKEFNSAPLVFTTVVHTDPLKNIHDATSVWAEEVTDTNFKVCLRELKNFDGVHEDIKVNVLALSSMPGDWPIPTLNGVTLDNDFIPTDETGYSFCETTNFQKPFFTTPNVVTTAAHDKNTIEPDNNAISEWVKFVNETSLEVCLEDIQRYDATHDPITVNYMAIGYIDPCYEVSCGDNKFCEVNTTDMTYTCECSSCETPLTYTQQVCDTEDQTHETGCELNRKICLGETKASWQHDGACQPFVLERGRVALRLNTTDVQCKTVYFDPKSFQSYEDKINVQTSINYFNTSGGFVHDAAVTWVESLTFSSFQVCALKAGRAERPTPDQGLTFVDYIAIQESPAGAAIGHLRMPSKWWDGTTCTNFTFEKNLFANTPYVFLTAEHTVLGQKHDAATVWVENVNANGFQACLREMQNFDGLHENITVNWIAYESLQNAAKIQSNQQIVNFPNDDPPKPAYHNAFCQDEKLSTTYSKVPTVIVSAGHSSGPDSDNLIPEYNSIASWIESVNRTNYRLCVKEIHKPNGYDPVTVTALIVGS